MTRRIIACLFRRCPSGLSLCFRLDGFGCPAATQGLVQFDPVHQGCQASLDVSLARTVQADFRCLYLQEAIYAHFVAQLGQTQAFASGLIDFLQSVNLLTIGGFARQSVSHFWKAS